MAGAKIFGPEGVLPTSPSVPEKILEICNFHIPQVVPFAGTAHCVKYVWEMEDNEGFTW